MSSPNQQFEKFSNALRWLKCTAAEQSYCLKFEECKRCPYQIENFNSGDAQQYARDMIEYFNAINEQSPAPSRWISIDQLPSELPNNTEIIVCTEKGRVTLVRVIMENTHAARPDMGFYAIGGDKVEPVAWMPKPIKVVKGVNDKGDLNKIKQQRRELLEGENGGKKK